ncbi:ribonuclease R [Desulfosediminicola ganghwensis]|uniref:ribonuclease R n=1 Tax=Desulfosediminicola ganghwensis TaxID=2569540 RepID=UPI0010ACB423|nr:ribonuclease R [Desulfosediminicola ganghwensis]
MTQKRYSRKKHHSKSSHKRGSSSKDQTIQHFEKQVLAYLYTSTEPASMADITRAVTGKSTLTQEVKGTFTHLLHTKTLTKADKKRFQLSPNAPLYEGTLQQHPRGFGFVSVAVKHAKAPDLAKDIHITSNRMGGAMHGDRVLVHTRRGGSSGRPEGTILKVLNPGADTIAGTIELTRRGCFVHPDDSRFPFTVEVNPAGFDNLANGIAVIAQFRRPEKPSPVIKGKIIELLGPADNIDVQMRLVIEKFHLSHIFSDETLAEANQLHESVKLTEDREDLRDILHVTIDGETAKDFDDAVCVTKTAQGFQLHVSIADVSHYVKPGSAIDTDAYQRGTSIYFPGRVIPMLPEKLSNNLCSLIPNVDRMAVTAVLDFDHSGKRIGKRFCRSVIKSHNRFTYTTVAQLVIDKDEETRNAFGPFLTMLDHANDLARVLLARRLERGSIGFSLPEAEIQLDTDGHIESITRAERNFAHQIIEEFMLAANEAVAETFTRKHRQSLYRIHELPDHDKIVEFSEFAKTLDLQLPPPESTAEWFGKVLKLCKGSPKEYIVNNLLLRAMQQARYSSDNVGHFALAATDYTHFTSPIRRYPDLIVHRELCAMLAEQSTRKKQTKAENTIKNDLREVGIFLSGRERTAVSSERDMADRLKLLYMEKHLGESFKAIISGVTDFAFFVELLDLFISGSVSLESLNDDYYLFDGKHHRVIGEVSGKIYQIGDIISVTASDVDRNKNRIYFEPSSQQ